MEVRKPSQNQLKELASLYLANNVITLGKDEKTIVSNLRRHLRKDTLLAAVENKEIASAIVAINTWGFEDHKTWELRHFVLKPDCYNRGFAESLVKIIENRIRPQSETCKIFIIVPEKEKDLELFKRMHFKTEGNIPNYYVYGENCVFMGKTFRKTEA